MVDDPLSSTTPDTSGGGASPAMLLVRALFDQSPFSIVIYDAEARIIAANEAFGRLWGVDDSTVPPGYRVVDDPELERQGLLPIVRRAFDPGEPVVTPIVRYDIARLSATGEGRSRWVEGHFHPVRNADGRLTHVVLVHVDLTRHAEAEAALRDRTQEYEEQVEEAQALTEQLERQRALLQQVLDALPESVGVYDRSWRPMYLNVAAARDAAASATAGVGRPAVATNPSAHGEALRAVTEHRITEHEAYVPERDQWLETRAVPLPDGAVVLTRDVTERRRTAEAMSLLARASALLATSLDYETTIDQLAHLTVPELADWCSVDLLTEEGELEQLAVAHVDPERVRWARELRTRYPPRLDDPTGLPKVIRTGEGEFYPDIPPSLLTQAAKDDEHLAILKSVGFRSVIIAPLTARGRTFGALTIVSTKESGRRYRESDRDTAEELARRAALAIDNARLYRAERNALDRVTRLQLATAAIARGVTLDEVTDVVLREGLAALGAQDGVVCRVTADGTCLDIVRQHGLSAEVATSFQRFPIDAPLPLSDAVRTGETVLLPDRAAVVARYPALREASARAATEAWVAVPLIAGGATLGGLAFGFTEAKQFSDRDRTFVEALAAQAAQALERARLLEAERAARVDAEAANRAKMDFLATMSHELRTPLNAIAGYVQLLEMGLRGPVTDEQRADLERIHRSQRTLQRLVEDVLDFAKLESGRLEYLVEDVPLVDALKRVEEVVALQLRDRDVRFTYHVDPDTIAVRADREKLGQILLNLLSNATKFTERGEIAITAVAEGTAVMVRVRDTGIGIPDDKLATIFEPFVQLDSGYTRRAEGTGLGLAISRDLARAMGGELTAEGHEGPGATFVLRLPRA